MPLRDGREPDPDRLPGSTSCRSLLRMAFRSGVDKVYLTTSTNGAGQVTAEHLTDHTYDARDRLVGIAQSACAVTAGTHTCTSTPVLTGATTYAHDDAGNRTQVTEDNGAGAVTRYYCHDARNQLTAVSTSSATCASGVIETYADTMRPAIGRPTAPEPSPTPPVASWRPAPRPAARPSSTPTAG